MGYAFTYAIGFQTKAFFLSWNWKGIGPGYSIDDSGIGIFGSTQAGNVHINALTMNYLPIYFHYDHTTAVFPAFRIPCSSRFSSRSSCSFTSCTYSNLLAEATAGGPIQLSPPLVEIQQWWIRTWAITWFSNRVLNPLSLLLQPLPLSLLLGIRTISDRRSWTERYVGSLATDTFFLIMTKATTVEADRWETLVLNTLNLPSIPRHGVKDNCNSSKLTLRRIVIDTHQTSAMNLRRALV